MANLKVSMFVVGPVQTNCYFAANTDTDEVLIIDPGAYGDRLAEMLKKDNLTPKAILLTHGHFDHVDGVEGLKAAFEEDIPVYALDKEKETLEDPAINLSSSMAFDPKSYSADVYLTDGQVIELAGFEIKVLHTPGHTPGGCCFYIESQKALFSGDSLFCSSIGRTDFPMGSMSELVRSVKERCLTLPEDTRVYPGHESITTIGDEKRYNPFLA